VQDSSDPEGLRVFYYLVQDLKALVFSLISLHFKVTLWGDVAAGVTVLTPGADQANLMASRRTRLPRKRSTTGKERLYMACPLPAHENPWERRVVMVMVVPVAVAQQPMSCALVLPPATATGLPTHRALARWESGRTNGI